MPQFRRVGGLVWRLAVLVRAPALVLVGMVSAAVVLRWLLGPLAWSVAGRTVSELTGKERADAINSVRQVVLAGAAGVLAVGGLAFTARTYYLARRGQVTDRYTKAVGLLASTEMAERVGGIYALEHVLRESPVDHAAVVDVLAAFIRDRAPVRSAEPGPPQAQEPRPTPDITDPRREQRPPADVQAALTILGRRPHRPEPHPLDLRHADLVGADLAGVRFDGVLLVGTSLYRANLRGAQLRGALLTVANLQEALLIGAQLQDANLGEAQLQGAVLTQAQLQDAELIGAQLQDANLREARLQGAMLRGTHLQGANLVSAQLQGAKLTRAQLQGAELDRAQLQGAYLGEAQLAGACLTGADLTDVGGLRRDQLLGATWSSEDAPPILDERHRLWLTAQRDRDSAQLAE